MALIFKPEKHEYISVDGDDIQWISATSFIGKFKQPFDAPTVAKRVSKSRKSKWYGMTPEEIQQAWSSEAKRATDLGTWYHNAREADICGLDTIRREGIDIPVFRPLLGDEGVKEAPSQKLSEGIYPEHMVYLKSAGICGQSDLVEVVNGKVNITDYKTNKEIKFKSFERWDGTRERMQAPLAHLDDCNFMHYSLQLSLYMYIIIKHNPTLKPGKMTIQHVVFEEQARDKFDNPITALDADDNPIVKEVICYDIPYMKQEIITLINWLKDNRDKITKK